MNLCPLSEGIFFEMFMQLYFLLFFILYSREEQNFVGRKNND